MFEVIHKNLSMYNTVNNFVSNIHCRKRLYNFGDFNILKVLNFHKSNYLQLSIFFNEETMQLFIMRQKSKHEYNQETGK
jgi:hypothetical protein